MASRIGIALFVAALTCAIGPTPGGTWAAGPAAPTTTPAYKLRAMEKFAAAKRAAETGGAKAAFRLGVMLYEGAGTPVDAAAAAASLQKAADADYPPALELLAELYERGRGVARDLAEAERWYRMAEDADGSGAIRHLTRIGAEPRRFLNRRLPEVRFEKVELADAIDFIRDVTGFNVIADWRGLADAGAAPKAPVTMARRDITVADALDAIVAQAGGKGKVGHRVIGGAIVIGTPDGLAAQAAAHHRRRRTEKVEPAVEAALARMLPEVKFVDVALTDVTDFLRDVSGTKFEVPWDALKEYGVDKTTPINLRLRNTPFGLIFDYVLLSAAGAGKMDWHFTSKDGVLVLNVAPKPKQ